MPLLINSMIPNFCIVVFIKCSPNRLKYYFCVVFRVYPISSLQFLYWRRNGMSQKQIIVNAAS